MRILVPLDGSPLAERALRPAVELLNRQRDGGELVIIRVMAVNPIPTFATYGGADVSALFDATEEDCAGYLREVARRLMFKGLALQTKVASGVPSEAICVTAQVTGADLIMLTSHGRTGLQKLALGSVAEAVVRNAHIPTFIVRPEGETFPDVGRFTPLTILVPLDGSPLAETALAPAITFARAFHGAVRLVRILEPGVDDQTLAAREAYAYLTEIHDKLEAHGVTAHRAVEWGAPAETIAALAQRYHADLIAIATHGRVWFGRMLNGSVAQTLLRDVELPVLLLHPANTALEVSDLDARLGPVIALMEE